MLITNDNASRVLGAVSLGELMGENDQVWFREQSANSVGRKQSANSVGRRQLANEVGKEQ